MLHTDHTGSDRYLVSPAVVPVGVGNVRVGTHAAVPACVTMYSSRLVG